ncbi:response regulator transcription factor [Sphingorhabdus sp.]|jgi:DNA-binding response OmpR family regulator|uniref:response regulator transcription factor n=1 Tax=Sphingorhabdus sp. TaxID=1902408 RepID=UPI0037CA4DE3
MKKFHIAVVEDDLAFAAELEEFLGASGYAVSSYDSSQKFLAALRQSECDLLIVDWSIPDLSGIEVLEYIRKFHPDMPAIMLTARAENIDIVRGLQAGADDYVSKPVDPDVLAMRIKSLLRRSKGEVKNVSENVTLGRYLLRPSTSTIYLGDEEIVLPKREFDMAMLFFTNPNRLLSRQYLAATLWGKVIDYHSRTIDTHVARLRKNLKLDPTCGISLNALYGFGYTLQADVHAMNAAHEHTAISA